MRHGPERVHSLGAERSAMSRRRFLVAAAAVAGSVAFPGVETVALIGRDEDSIAADEEDASRWASAYLLDTVLTDPTSATVNRWSEASSCKTYVIAADGTITLVLYGAATSDEIAAGLQG